MSYFFKNRKIAERWGPCLPDPRISCPCHLPQWRIPGYASDRENVLSISFRLWYNSF